MIIIIIFFFPFCMCVYFFCDRETCGNWGVRITEWIVWCLFLWEIIIPVHLISSIPLLTICTVIRKLNWGSQLTTRWVTAWVTGTIFHQPAFFSFPLEWRTWLDPWMLDLYREQRKISYSHVFFFCCEWILLSSVWNKICPVCVVCG